MYEAMPKIIQECLKMRSLGHVSTNYLVWKLRKVFSEQHLPRNKMVVVTYPGGETKMVSLQEFQIIKKTLPLGAVFRLIPHHETL